MPDSILMATSIAPNSRIETQRLAVESWLSQGVDLISFNAPDEIETLINDFRNIQFAPVSRTAQSLVNKPLVFVCDILAHLKNSGHRYVGLTNSDIHLSDEPGLAAFMQAQAEHSFVSGPRFDVDDLNSASGILDPVGFDYFLFDRELECAWDDNKLCLGMPFWDHWLPLSFALNGHKVKILSSPVARHERHAVAWSDETLVFNDEFIRALIACQNRFPGPSDDPRIEEFRALEIERNYYRLKYRLQESSDAEADPDDQMTGLEELARFFDDVTRHVVKFIRRQAEQISV